MKTSPAKQELLHQPQARASKMRETCGSTEGLWLDEQGGNSNAAAITFPTCFHLTVGAPWQHESGNSN